MRCGKRTTEFRKKGRKPFRPLFILYLTVTFFPSREKDPAKVIARIVSERRLKAKVKLESRLREAEL